MFTDVPAGRYFVAGKPSGHSLFERRHPRRPGCGGTAAAAARAVADVGASDRPVRGELLISLCENRPDVMEAGLMFPGLGQEEQWFQEDRARLTGSGIL